MHLRHGRPHRIRGWALFRSRSARLPQRRFMRLIHYTLTVFDAADEEADLVILEEVLVGAQVSGSKRRREITIKLPSDRVIVTLRKDHEYEAWFGAFRDAARVATDFYKIVTTRELGAGAFSTVYFGFDREDGHHVAIKVVKKTQCTRAELSCAETEARMMAYLRHPSIVLCRDIFDAPDAMHVVMQYMSGATLEQRMLSSPPHLRRFSEQVAATVMCHVLSALSYLEAEGVCHRDVKPDNILLSALPNDSLWPTTARLSDFGLAAFVESDVELVDVVGTPHYVAPEVVSRNENDEFIGYGPPVDVWAAGIMMYWMLSGGDLPFDGEDPPAIFKAIRAGRLHLDDDDDDSNNTITTNNNMDDLHVHNSKIDNESDMDANHIDITSIDLNHCNDNENENENNDSNNEDDQNKTLTTNLTNHTTTTITTSTSTVTTNDMLNYKPKSNSCWKSISPEGKSLLRSLLNPSPWTRLSACGATTHPWLLQAQNVSLPSSYASRFSDQRKRKATLSPRNRLRSAALAVLAMQSLMDFGECGTHSQHSQGQVGVVGQRRRGAERERERKRTMHSSLHSRKSDKKMAKAPERAPIGADGLAYNVGLIPSFTPKRRAKAGSIPPSPIGASSSPSTTSTCNTTTNNSSTNSNSNTATKTKTKTKKTTTTNLNQTSSLSSSSTVAAVAAMVGSVGGRKRDKGSEEGSAGGASSVRVSRDSRRSISSGSRTPSRERGVSVDKQGTNSEKRGLSFDRRGGSVDRKSVGSSGTTYSNMAWAFLLRSSSRTPDGNNDIP